MHLAPNISDMWSAFEPNGILLPAGQSNNNTDGSNSIQPPDVFQMMWNSAFSSFVNPDVIKPGTERDEAVLQKHLCATSLLQQALSILSKRSSSELADNPIPSKHIGELESLMVFLFESEHGIWDLL